MKIYKTNYKERDTYTYTFTSADDKEERIVIRPRENGVTETNIKILHALDDCEVYYSNKNLRPKRTS